MNKEIDNITAAASRKEKRSGVNSADTIAILSVPSNGWNDTENSININGDT